MALAETLEKLVEDAFERAAFSGVAHVALPDGRRFIFARGWNSADKNTPLATDAIFRIASLTKPLIATLALLLEERALLDLDAPAALYIGNIMPRAFSAESHKVTLRHLLTHTSGCPAYEETAVKHALARSRPVSPTEIISAVFNEPLRARPGEHFEYSNTGYTLIGMLLEAASGWYLDVLLKKELFDPLGMSSTGRLLDAPAAAKATRGFYLERGSRSDRLQGSGINDPNVTCLWAAADLYSSASDLDIFLESLASERILSRKALTTLLKPGLDGYACGWRTIHEADLATVHFHTGSLIPDAFTTEMLWSASAGIRVVVLCNQDCYSVDRTLARRLALAALSNAT
jgi:CubicO group peptidase (beta-lactamase class C family)